MAFRTIEVQLRANVASYQASMGAATASTKQLGREIAQLAASSNEAVRAAGKVGVVVGGAIVAGFGLAIREASKFETSMRNTNSIMKQSESEFRATSAAVLDLSRRVPQAATTLADGLYDIASSGFQGAEGLQVLESSAIAATAGMTDTATSAKAITGILNAYGQSAAEAGDISDILFQTVNLGVITFEELASSVGNWVGTAAALKVPVDEASAALATMTLSGIGAAEASTALNRVMQSFIKPTEDMATRINELGYESGVAMVEMLGLDGAVRAIEESTGGSVEQTANLYGEVRAIKGVLALTAGDGENYARVLGEITDESARAGAAQEAYEEQSKSFSVQMDLAKSSVSAVAIEIGTAFLPAMTSAAQFVGQAADAFAGLPGPIRTVVVVMTGAAGVIGLVGGAAILAAPRIIAFNTAVKGLAETSPRAAAGLGRLSTAMSVLGRGAIIGSVVIGLASMSKALGEMVAGAERANPEVAGLTRSLGVLGQGGEITGTLAAAFGRDFESIIAVLDETDDKMKDVSFFSRENVGNILAGKNLGAEEAREQVDALDQSLSALLAQDYDSGSRAWARLSAQWQASGGSLERLKELFPGVQDQLALTAAEIKLDAAAAEELAAAADELGISFDETSDLAALTTEEMTELRGELEPVIFAMLELGDVTVEEAKKMQESFENIGDSFGEFTDGLGAYKTAFSEAEARAREHGEEMVTIDNKAVDHKIEGIRKGAAATADNLAREAQDHIATAGLTGEAATKVRRAAEDKAGAVREAADAEIEALGETKTSWEDYVDEVQVSTEELIAEWEAQIAAQEEWAENLQTIASRGRSDVATELAKLGPEGAALTKQFANMTNDEFRRAADLFVATTRDGGARAGAALDQQLKIAERIGRAGAKDTVESIAAEMGVLPGIVSRIANDMEVTLNSVWQNLAAARYVLGLTQLEAQRGGARTAGLQERWGGVLEYAHGGITQAHVARGTIVKYAEPETGGEAFVPRRGNPSRSMQVLKTAASWYGASVVSNRWGGVLPDAGMGGGAGGGYAAVGIDYERLAAAVGERVQVNIDVPPGVVENERDLGRELHSALYTAGVS